MHIFHSRNQKSKWGLYAWYILPFNLMLLLCSRSLFLTKCSVLWSYGSQWAVLCNWWSVLGNHLFLIFLSTTWTCCLSLFILRSDYCGSDPALLPPGNQCLDWSDRHCCVSSCAVLCGHKAVPNTEEHSGAYIHWLFNRDTGLFALVLVILAL